jgi:glycerol uptake facilitator-like aquaporin
MIDDANAPINAERQALLTKQQLGVIHEPIRAGNYWWWVPIVGPLVGGVLGGWIYDAFVGKHFPTK